MEMKRPRIAKPILKKQNKTKRKDFHFPVPKVTL
jgi:hypothetical protein